MVGNASGSSDNLASRRYWDKAADTFDDETDHGMRDSDALRAWTKLLTTWLPQPGARILDIGCGTGSLSVVLADLGFKVVGFDSAPRMLAAAKAKARKLERRVGFALMEATAPGFAPRSFDAVICRHVLWALPERQQVMSRWSELLRPTGRILLIEGYWSTGSGVRATELIAQLPSSLALVIMEDLSDRRALWGKKVTDERYALVADRIANS